MELNSHGTDPKVANNTIASLRKKVESYIFAVHPYRSSALKLWIIKRNFQKIKKKCNINKA